MRVATKDLVLILNSDVILTKGYFSDLLSYFDKSDTFGVMGQITDFKSNKIIDGAKYPAYSFGNINSTKNYVCKDSNSHYSFFLSGANALVDRKKIQEIDYFNELFNPYYFEDVDLSLRAWRMGYKIYYEHNAVCKHATSETIKKEPSDNVKIIAKRNKLFLHYLHFKGIELVFFFVISFLKAFFRIFIFDFKYFKSFSLFIESLKKIRMSKKQFEVIQKQKGIKNISVSKISNIIKKEINETEIKVF